MSAFKNGCLLTLLWKLGALSGNGLNNATQFSLSFIRKDIVVPAVNRCGIDHVLRGGGNGLWQNQSCLRDGVEAQSLVPKALTPCKTGRGQASIINKLEILKEREQVVTNKVTQASTQLINGGRAFGPHRKLLLPFELQHKDRPIFQENFKGHEVVRAVS